ncbi:Hypothetical_protein [Hexamita inflata]|uniref:Hypothetical_protein n=1 Tax=Hexamita inflata TaxID=28002 RepID=A0AA86QMM9_9EUKA|nr:Hypothetical protein HINF_LOCUS48718 [Hexamita inflata]
MSIVLVSSSPSAVSDFLSKCDIVRSALSLDISAYNLKLPYSVITFDEFTKYCHTLQTQLVLFLLDVQDAKFHTHMSKIKYLVAKMHQECALVFVKPGSSQYPVPETSLKSFQVHFQAEELRNFINGYCNQMNHTKVLKLLLINYTQFLTGVFTDYETHQKLKYLGQLLAQKLMIYQKFNPVFILQVVLGEIIEAEYSERTLRTVKVKKVKRELLGFAIGFLEKWGELEWITVEVEGDTVSFK